MIDIGFGVLALLFQRLMSFRSVLDSTTFAA